MGKSVRNTSEGILGAIKTVTNKPANKSAGDRASEPLPNVPKFQTLIATEPEVTSPNAENPRHVKTSPIGGQEGDLNSTAAKPKKSGTKSAVGWNSKAAKTTISRTQVGVDESPVDARNQNPIEENNAKIRARKKKAERLEALEKVVKSSSARLADLGTTVRSPESASTATESVGAKEEGVSIVSEDGPLVMLDSFDLEEKSHAFLVDKIRGEVSRNLTDVDSVDICKPDVSIVGPVFNALQYAYHQPQMIKLYGNLISTAMNVKTARFAHPGFVDLIRNITQDEARVLSWFFKYKVLPVIDIKKVITKTQSEMRLNTLVSTIAQDAGLEFDDLAEGYLANLERVGLLEIPRTVCLTDDSLYIKVLSIPAVQERLEALNSANKDYFGEIVRYYAKLSVFGIRFCHACIR